MRHDFDILTVEEMGEADRQTIASGVEGQVLMENAGRSVLWQILKRFAPCETLVLCGPGNNGGDGYVVARLLQGKGWRVRVAYLGDPKSLSGDAAIMAGKWSGPSEPISKECIGNACLVVDALFGAGLCRPISDDLGDVFRAINERGIAVVAVDIPTGIDGNSGQILGAALKADLSVTFFRGKPGHYLLPGRVYSGDVRISDIGIADAVLSDINPKCRRNDPALWREFLPRPDIAGHKYHRGHGLIRSGRLSAIGAAQLAAKACLKIGAGAVTIAAEGNAIVGHAGNLNALMLARIDDPASLTQFIDDRRISAVLIGPGNGVNEQTRTCVLAALATDADVVLDADALTVFADNPKMLFDAIAQKTGGAVVLTPHEAEFARLFDPGGDKLTRARAAARLSGACVILKGADSVIASPDGDCVINDHAAAYLATAGAGDVLGGIIAGLLAQGMPQFAAASAAVWIHGDGAVKFGAGLTAEDLILGIPEILRRII